MTRLKVVDLVATGVLRVEDGNHGNDRPRPDEFVLEGVPFIRAADMTSGVVDFQGAGKINGVARHRIRKGVGAPGDVILSHKGTVGKIAVAPIDAPDFVCSPQTTFWRSLDETRLHQRYLRYAMHSGDFQSQLNVLKGQTDMAPYVSLTDQRGILLDLPDVSQQRAIADVLGALDDKIAANNDLISTAKLLGVSTAATFEDVTPLAEVVTHHKRMVSPESIADCLVEHYSLPAFDASNVPEEVAPSMIKSGKFSFDKPCVLISKLNPRFPRIWDVPTVGPAIALASTEFLVLESRYSTPTVLWAVLSQPSFSASLETQVAGTSGSHQRVKPADLLATAVIDPRSMSDSAKDKITSLGKSIALYRQESRKLAELRDTLLPELMSGRLRVKDAERIGEVQVS